MKYFTLGFIISSLAYLILTVVMGIIFLTGGVFMRSSIFSNYGFVVAIVHSFLLGFATMLIFGVNYHIIPIFSGRDFYSEKLAYLHLAMGNIGILGFVLPLPFSSYPIGIHPVVNLSSLLFGLSILVFIYNMLKTFISPVNKTPFHNPFGEGDKAADKMAIRFTGVSIIYLVIGCPLGILFLLRPDYIFYLRPVHAHINLIGFVSIMIFGVSYHMFPRFAGKPLYNVQMGRIQFWFANIGLIGMILSWWLLEAGSAVQKASLLSFAVIEAIAAALYIYNSWKTLANKT
ncbi:MAG: cbb3-type cytochrome c oxidase subunit I [Deltaproteobacteria bacterium]|nr:cbb3-type cytochrome c oxidase subunit I [Deltaproteobacteria bacterium]